MLRVLILVIALGAGGLAGWLVLNARPREAVTVAPSTPVVAHPTEVLVAASDLSQGQTLEGKNVRWQSWPKDAVSPGFITREAKPDAVNSLNGALVRNHFLAGEPIREERLSRGPAGMLATMLPSGKRAIAIRVTAESTAGGFILPNDRADVIQNLPAPEGGLTPTKSRTLLRNVRVLAVDQKADETKGLMVVLGKTVTLEVTPAEAEMIAAAQATGTLSLALRSIADLEEKPVAAQDGGVSVRVFRAGKSEEVRVPSESSVVR